MWHKVFLKEILKYNNPKVISLQFSDYSCFNKHVFSSFHTITFEPFDRFFFFNLN